MLQALYERMDGARIAVIGDFCLDAYWKADMRRSELSREVPHYPLPIMEERYAPGGAGNVACNAAALKPREVLTIGVLGDDWRGNLLRRYLEEAGVNTDGLIADEARVTNAYIKPLRCGISETVYEDPRLDFENHAPLSSQAEERLLGVLEAARWDVLCVCDQMKYGCISHAVRERICDLGRAGKMVLVDSRDRVEEYRHVIVKPNEVEVMRAVPNATSFDEAALALSRRTHMPVLVTLGSQGCLVCENETIVALPARKVSPPIDICGAGDTFLSATACALAAGASLRDAAALANAASAVTTKKLHMTGTVSREELMEQWRQA